MWLARWSAALPLHLRYTPVPHRFSLRCLSAGQFSCSGLRHGGSRAGLSLRGGTPSSDPAHGKRVSFARPETGARGGGMGASLGALPDSVFEVESLDRTRGFGER